MEKRMLVLSAHPDDGEMGAGGTMSRAIEEGWEITQAVFCASENIGLSKMPKEAMFAEFENANKVIGVNNIIMFDFPHRRLNEVRQDILQKMCDLKQETNPTLVIIPSSDDLHQDHETIAKEGMRTFKQCNLWGSEFIWNNLMFNARTFVKLEERHIEQKVTALQQYESQRLKPYFDSEFVRNLASVRGIQIGSSYAECFEHIRGVI